MHGSKVHSEGGGKTPRRILSTFVSFLAVRLSPYKILLTTNVPLRCSKPRLTGEVQRAHALSKRNEVCHHVETILFVILT